MHANDYRPLPECLRHSGIGPAPAPEAGAQVPQMPEPTTEMLEMMKQDEIRKKARMPLAEKFTAGTASFDGVTLPYRLFVPEQAAAGSRLPMVVFLHGGGERGTDNLSQLTANDGAVVWVRDQLETPEKACFVLAAQCPDTEPGWLEKHLLVVANLMEQLLAQYPIDETRLYLTGMSMGGGGCWRFNCMFPELFAAVVPMCSACGLDRTGKAIDPAAIDAAASAFLKKPLWLFHAADDFVVTPETTRSLANALEQAGLKRGVDFFYTEYPAECGFNHGCWNPAYAWQLMRDWLFAQTTEPAAPPVLEPPFPVEDMEKMLQLEAQEKKARLDWLPRFTPGGCVSKDVTVPYQLYVPEAAASGQARLPLVVMLHGIGGCGCDNVGQLTDNDGVIDWVRGQDSGIIPACFVMAPQCPLPIPNGMWEIPYLQLVAEEIGRLQQQYPIDPSRIYLSGLSLGGYGSWNLNRLLPDTFAAIVTCCPACVAGPIFRSHIDHDGLARCAPALMDKPLWMFHAEDDFAVPVEVTRLMAQRLRDAGKPDDDSFHVTIYPAEKRYNHRCWDAAYKDAEMFRWLFSQKL